MPACTKEAEGVSEGNYAWVSTYAGKYYDGSAWKAGQTGISKEFVFQIKCNTTQDYDGNSGGNTFQVFLVIFLIIQPIKSAISHITNK